jgi:hypothetical protein
MRKEEKPLRNTPVFLLLVLSLIFSCAVSDASPVPEDFQFSATMQGPLKKGSLYSVHLSAKVLEACLPDCRDVRILASDNQEIPYVIIENAAKEGKGQTYQLEVLKYEEAHEDAVITVKLPGKYEPIGMITLETPSRDFKKGVLLYGSHDSRNWKLLAEDSFYDFSPEVDLRKTAIRFDKTDYRYYRLRLVERKNTGGEDGAISLKYNGLDFSAGKRETKNIRIDRILGHTAPEKDTDTVYDEADLKDFTVKADKDGNTVIMFESGLPVSRIFFDVANPYYYRRGSLYASDTGKEDSFLLLTGGVLYRFSLPGLTETKNYLELLPSARRFYRIVIENLSSPPLQISGIKLAWVQKNLFFVALQDTAAYSLFFGSDHLARPDYDLSNFINRNNWFRHSHEKLEISDLQRNARYQAKLPKDMRSRIESILLKSIVVLLVIVTGFWLFLLLRKTGDKTHV